MWTLISFIHLLGLCCAGSSTLPNPTNVSFSSVNLRNVLHWFPGNGTPDDTHFTVEYAIYGDTIEGSKGRRVQWRAVWQCTDIIRTWCDLTTETWDVEHGYNARVRATGRRSSSKWTVTRRFDPKSDTTFGPPLVSLEVENNSAIITLMGPMRYPSNNHTPELSMAAVYPHMSYTLFIHNIHRNQMHHFPVAASSYRYHLLDYNTEYCFSAKSTFPSMPVRCQSSAWHCITTPQDPMVEQLQKVVVGIVVPSLCICIIVVVCYLLYNYLTGRGQKSPFILNPPSFHLLHLVLPPDNPNLSQSSVIKANPPSDSSCPEPHPSIAPPSGGYSLQRPEAPPQLEVSGDDLSVDYGSVLVVSVHKGEEKEVGEMKHDNGDCGEPQKDKDRGNNDGDSIYPPQAKPCIPQSKTYTYRQTHMPTHTHREASSLWSQVKSPFQPQVRSGCCQESVRTKLNIREKGGEPPGIFIRKIPQTGRFNVLPNLPTQRHVEEQGETAEKRDGVEEEESESEKVPLVSGYARQNIENMSMCHPNQSDCLLDDYGLLELQKTEDHFADDEEEEGSSCINWDPETGNLEKEMGFKKEEKLSGLTTSESRRKDSIAGEDEMMYVRRVQPQLNSVIVRQTSEEEAEAEMERVLEGVEENDVLKKWDLVIPISQ